MSSERNFLHDLASPIGAALFSLSCIVDNTANWPKEMQAEAAHVKRAMDALVAAQKLMSDRRDFLINQGESNECLKNDTDR